MAVVQGEAEQADGRGAVADAEVLPVGPVLIEYLLVPGHGIFAVVITHIGTDQPGSRQPLFCGVFQRFQAKGG